MMAWPSSFVCATVCTLVVVSTAHRSVFGERDGSLTRDWEEPACCCKQQTKAACKYMYDGSASDMGEGLCCKVKPGGCPTFSFYHQYDMSKCDMLRDMTDDAALQKLLDSKQVALDPASFSPVGQAVIKSLANHWAEKFGKTWNITTDVFFDDDWLLATPGNQIGRTSDTLLVPDRCTNQTGCSPDFGLYECETQKDCETGEGGMRGKCTPIQATVIVEGQSPVSLCAGHSDFFYDRMYSALVQAQHYIDIASLAAPDGRFLAAWRNAFTYLHNTKRPVQVRVLFGTLAGTAKSILDDFLRDVPKEKGASSLKVTVGLFRAGLTWWNHAKIISVDGKWLLQGGHNPWEKHYLGVAPVHDVSMVVKGQVAIDAHRFLNQVWPSLCQFHLVDVLGRLGKYKKIAHFPPHKLRGNVVTRRFTSKQCPPPYTSPYVPNPEIGSRTIAVGRIGGKFYTPGAGDSAVEFMFASAQRYIKLSIQDLGAAHSGKIGISAWHSETMVALCNAALRGVHVYIVMSEPYATAGEQHWTEALYGNGWTAQYVARKFMIWMRDRLSGEHIPHGVKPEDFERIVCERIHVTTMRYSKDEGDDHWPGVIDQYSKRFGNHAKLYIVDDTFYIGSQNLYPANLAEYGLIVDDPRKTADLIEKYWNPLWEAASPVAVSGLGNKCQIDTI